MENYTKKKLSRIEIMDTKKFNEVLLDIKEQLAELKNQLSDFKELLEKD